jgi:hypothetical protein
MSAVEDALVGHDYRSAKAWGLALAVAIVATQLAWSAGWTDLTRTLYSGPRLHLLGVTAGGVLFGLGMTLVGTCSFGLLVRAGGGDLRAAMSAMVVGIVAISTTAGTLTSLRTPLLDFGVVSVDGYGGPSLHGLLSTALGSSPAMLLETVALFGLVSFALLDRRLRKRKRLLIASVLMGLAIAGGWVLTSRAVEAMTLDRPESLSFVAPVGRALLQFMMDPFRNVGFGVSAALSAALASLAVAWWRSEFRWEAFDDATEMRRHLLGGSLMAVGGVLAQGCTIGQGMTAASTLAISAPIFIACVLVGAKLGLWYLIEGHARWRVT